jgi:hypothetical protein
VESTDFIETTHGIQGIEVTCVGCGKVRGFEVSGAKVCVTKCLGTLPSKKMKTQPTPVGRGDALRFSEKGDEE